MNPGTVTKNFVRKFPGDVSDYIILQLFIMVYYKENASFNYITIKKSKQK